jgi:hypothetical protein
VRTKSKSSIGVPPMVYNEVKKDRPARAGPFFLVRHACRVFRR